MREGIGMEFYAAAFKYQEDVFFDFEEMEDRHGLESTCLLPSLEVAEQMIGDHLGDEYAPVKIILVSLREGIWSWEREEFPIWDEEDY